MWKYNQNQMGAQGNPNSGNMLPSGFPPQGAGMHGMHPQQQQQMMQQQQLQMQQQQMAIGAAGVAQGGAQMNMAPGQGMPMAPNAGLMHQPVVAQQQQQHQQQPLMGSVPHQQQQHLMQQVPQMNQVQPQQQLQPQQKLQQQQFPQPQQQPQHVSGAQMGASAPPGGNNNMLGIAQPNQHKEMNIVQLTRLGQETVQDIVTRFQDVFTCLKSIQPTSHRDNNMEKKVQECFRTIRLLFKRVRIVYDKCNDAGMDFVPVESLIPYKDEPETRPDPVMTEEIRKAQQENQELCEIVKLKNRQLREIIDRMRMIIWEVNTMLSMRRS